MAFLCPVRIRRGKKKKDECHPEYGDEESPQLGRITGSSSIETLVRVGLEKEAGLSPDSRHVVLHDFTPCVDDELQVKRGDIVNILYRENDWVYVLHDNREGFIPHSYTSPYGSHLSEMALESDAEINKNNTLNRNSLKKLSRDSDSNSKNTHSDPDDNNEGSVASKTTQDSVAHPFYKDPLGRYIVLYKFTARDENDMNVERGELLTVLNKDDPDWHWVLRSDGQEGFVPAAFIYPLNQTMQANVKTNESECNQQSLGSELVLLYDYKAQAPDDLSVRRGDWVYADIKNQTVDGWIWAFAPKQRKYGFIPKAYARPPAMTSL
ncbi:unnamed protein product [Allacma fusca]|uniref:SH3 domain-containing protein n=1 Tax=Allacma fusca TaxID=39272 RepID=A0A8J2LGN6_9HEXA|nr:unnamed protein product [Allacma fusca]